MDYSISGSGGDGSSIGINNDGDLVPDSDMGGPKRTNHGISNQY